MSPGKPAEPRPLLEHFVLLSSNAPPEIHDIFSQKNLRQALMDASTRRLPAIARVHLELDGVAQDDIAQVLARSPLVGRVGVVFHQPTMQKEAWEYTTPAAVIAFDVRGPGKIVTFHYNPRSITPWDLEDRGTEEPCVVRINVKEGFIPRSIRQEQMAIKGTPLPLPKFEIFSMADLAAFVHRTGIVPFRISLLAYTTKARYAYDIDLVNNVLVRDPRSGRLPVTNRAVRSARLFHGLDRYIARREIPPVPAKILEILFETNELHPAEVSSVLGINQELAIASLSTLVDRTLATYNRASNTYRPLPRAFLTSTEADMESQEEQEMRKSPEGEPGTAAEEAPADEPAAVGEEAPVVAAAVPSAPAPSPEPPLASPDIPVAASAPAPPAAPAPGTEAASPVSDPAPPAAEPEAPGSFPVVSPTLSAPTGVRAREEVQKLLEMLEAKPTCPGCGREMDASDLEILCPECRKEMQGLSG